jgi:hypothetical protein
VEVALAGARPVDEVDALLERGVALADEARLVEADGVEGAADRRERAFAHADDADVAGLHQRHADAACGGAQRAREEGRGEPAGGAAADDEDVLDGLHGACLRSGEACCIPPFLGAAIGVGIYPGPFWLLLIGDHIDKKTTLSFLR